MTLHKKNLLAKERSPYLLQHANNPVDWYPWGDEAFQKASREKKPVLVSIGYAACHWCHVMAHESFEDPETANLMNELFVNIKVDREERPDIDKIYQTAHFLLTSQGGGWPLTIFLTSDTRAPFFSGTYFPREARYQLPSFKEILRVIADVYAKKPDLIKQQSLEMKQILAPNSSTITKDVTLSLVPLQSANATLARQSDSIYGGFGGAPKFPQVSKLEFLLSGEGDSPIVFNTLKNMAEGGIYDQLGGGFFRYAVDEAWLIPHFEKMLYDNGQLLFLYAISAKIYGEQSFLEVTRQTSDWIIREMQSPQGGFYASMDADSEGKEGKFYLWDKDEIENLLDKDQFQAVYLYYGLYQLPSLENKWHFSISKSPDVIAEEMKISENEVMKLLRSAKEKLLNLRKKRIPPYLDKKILTSWNSLVIKGLLAAGQSLGELVYTNAAKRGLEFIYKEVWVNKHLFSCYKDNEAYNDAYLDDYAFLLDTILYSLQIEWNDEYFIWANDLAQHLLNHFYDDNHGGFYFTADDHEVLFFRPKVWIDEAVPSGNGIAVQALLNLGHLSGNMQYIDAAEKTLKSVWPNLTAYPHEHASLLLGLKELLDPGPFVILRGHEIQMKEWYDICWNDNPFSKIFAIPDTTKLPELEKYKYNKNLVAYVCRGVQCKTVSDLKLLEKIITSKSKVTNN